MVGDRVMMLSNLYIDFDLNDHESKPVAYFESIFKNFRSFIKSNPTTVIPVQYGPHSVTNFSIALKRFMLSMKIHDRTMLDICRVNGLFIDPNEF